ncbi:MAG: C69 family dipeptidase [Thermoanaerobaculales bacterium]|nr:C69 family dipeptidase [Thermoanaerobaculales bacterium]
MKRRLTILISSAIWLVLLAAPDFGFACTSIMVGKAASTDGSVMTSHTCDSHRTGSAIHIVARRRHPPGTEIELTKRSDDDSGPMQRYGRVPTGALPQVEESFGYLNPAYAAMNEFQVAIGESTFGGRKELVSEEGLIDCETFTRLMLERARTAREAIRIGGALLERYGWIDEGEGLTIADPNEVWLMEIVGVGSGRVGAVWAAQRVPDDHVSVIANSSRIGELDLADPDSFMASENVVTFAVEQGYWSPERGRPFRFYEAYDPEGNFSFSCSRRIWRVLDLLVPSLELHGNSNHYPFSVKPEKPVGPEIVMELLRDTYEGTDYDPVKHLTVTDEEGRTVKSPLANPFMPYDMNRLLRTNGGWGWRGERPIARWYCMYATVIQARGWLPDPVGGIVWFGYGNPAMTTYVPLYAGITELPVDFKTDGRTTGFSRDTAWWAFNRVGTLAAQRWGDMRNDVAEARDPLQARYLEMQAAVAAEATRLFAENPEMARAYLTAISNRACEEVTAAYWELGDHLWTAYDEKW